MAAALVSAQWQRAVQAAAGSRQACLLLPNARSPAHSLPHPPATAAADCAGCTNGTPGERRVKKGATGYYAAETCKTGAGGFYSCSKFYFTGIQRAASCNGENKCFAQIQLYQGGPNYWLESFTCSQGSGSSVAVMPNNELCGGGE